MTPTLESWVAFALTAAALSYVLFRENPAYRVAESLFVGVSLGNVVVMAVRSLQSTAINPLLSGNLSLLAPVALGLLLFTVYSRRLGKASSWPIAVMAGVGVGLAIRGAAHTYIYDQVKASATPLDASTPTALLNGVIVLAGTLCTLGYFLFTVEGGAAGERVRSLGRLAMMLFFGAMFGQVTLTRLTYISGRAQFLVQFLQSLLT